MRILLALLFLVVIAASSLAQSQRRAPQVRIQQPEPAIAQQKPQENQKGTEQSPFVVKVVPSSKTDEDRAQEAADRERIAESERKKEQSDADLVRYTRELALYTGELALFTKGLFAATVVLVLATMGLLGAAFVQSRDTKEAIKQATRSADAAHSAIDETERHAKILERAYLWPGFGDWKPLEGGGAKWFITVWNSGHTAGVIRIVNHALINKSDFEAGTFKYEMFDKRENVIPPDMRPGEIIKTGVFREVRGDMVCCGYIVYVDVFGCEREQGWKHVLHPDGTSDSLPGCYSDPPDKNHPTQPKDE